MAPTIPSFADVSSEDLLVEIPHLASNERHATAALVAALAVMDERKPYVREGYSSLFAYCTSRLHLSESATCRRIDAARACRAFPLVLERLAEGTLTLAAVSMLAKHLTGENHVEVLDAARHRSKRDLEELVARLAPRPDVPSSIRRLPVPQPRGGCGSGRQRAEAAERSGGGGGQAPGSVDEAPFAVGGSLLEPPRDEEAAPATSTHGRVRAAKPAVIRPLAPTRYQVTVTVSADTHAKLLQARDLLRHEIPSGDPALVLDRALTVLLQQLERTKFAASVGRKPVAATPGVRPPTKRRSARSAATNTASAPAGDSGETGTGAEDRGLPAARSRRIPAAVRREVWARSQGQCEFVSDAGHRCESRALLEFHHRVPFSVGGLNTATNVAIHCGAHNAHEAETFFGAAYIKVRRSSSSHGQWQRESGRQSPLTAGGGGEHKPGTRGDVMGLLQRET